MPALASLIVNSGFTEQEHHRAEVADRTLRFERGRGRDIIDPHA